ncbi:MAG TPA: PepSY-associated TM helix domain-containing protein [Vicinamibacteria bacterium]|nr:PepSY-associated TM helix domain-containing protein [Vicinamibacteria bacterium]
MTRAAHLRVRRAFWVWLHRWCGLVMAGFLTVAGLTGSLLAFNFELERAFAPQLFAKAPPNPQPLDFATLADRAQALVPEARVDWVGYTDVGQVRVDFTAGTNPATGRPYDLGFDEFFIDPWTGRELGRRMAGDLRAGAVNVMPFIYRLHWTLLGGDTGQWIMGLVALVWTLDCVNGFYLTLPVRFRGFWRKWRLAWAIERRASRFRLNFDLHRASGLWLWPLLFMFAWSSVMMNIRPVYERVMRVLFDYRSPDETYGPMGVGTEAPRLDWHQALAAGERLMAEQSRLHGFRVGEPLALMYLPWAGTYVYEVRGSRDLFERAPKGGGTAVMFDGRSGAFRMLDQPTGEHAGNTVESWLYALHMARVFGRPYQVLVCVLGLLTAVLSWTGVYVWSVKREARRVVAERRRAPA